MVTCMQRFECAPLLLLTTLLCLSQASSQVDVSTFSVRAGIIRTEWLDNGLADGHLWSFYPEVEVGGRFIMPFLSWGVSWGYWSDGINQALPYADFVTYSRQAHIVSGNIGLRIQSAAPHFPVPLEVFVGASQHFSKVSYIGGTDLAGRAGTGSTQQTTTGLVGVALSVPVIAPLELTAQVFQVIPLGSNALDHLQSGRRAFLLGFTVVF